jgi:hypothetical protein
MLDLTEEETDALARLLSRAIDDDRYPLSARIQMLKAILAKIRPETVREPLPPLKQLRAPRGRREKAAPRLVMMALDPLLRFDRISRRGDNGRMSGLQDSYR